MILEALKDFRTDDPKLLKEQLQELQVRMERALVSVLVRGVAGIRRITDKTTPAVVHGGDELIVADTTFGDARCLLPAASKVANRLLAVAKSAAGNRFYVQPISGKINGTGALGLANVGLHLLFSDGVQYWALPAIDSTNQSGAGGGLARPHDLTHNPVALWQLDETLNDTSGNSFNLALLAGVTRYTEMLPGIPALNLFINNKYRHNVTGTALAITGDLTIEMLIRWRAYTAGAVLSYDTNGETQADNYLYAVALTSGSTQTQFTSEHGAGINDEHNIDFLPPLYQPCHFAARRQSNVVQFFLDGKPWGPASSALTTPDGGGNSKFHLGWVASDAADCDVASIKIISSALNDAQILAEYNRTLGPFYGERT